MVTIALNNIRSRGNLLKYDTAAQAGSVGGLTGEVETGRTIRDNDPNNEVCRSDG